MWDRSGCPDSIPLAAVGLSALQKQGVRWEEQPRAEKLMGERRTFRQGRAEAAQGTVAMRLEVKFLSVEM